MQVFDKKKLFWRSKCQWPLAQQNELYMLLWYKIGIDLIKPFVKTEFRMSSTGPCVSILSASEQITATVTV